MLIPWKITLKIRTMEVKKSPKADLQNKKGIFFEIGLVGSLLLVIGMFSWSKAEVEIQELETVQTIVEEEIVEITREDQKPPEAPKQVMQVTSDIINIVKDDKKIETTFTFNEIGEDVEIVFQPVGGGGQEEAVEEDAPFLNVEEMPSFQGGDLNKFRNWVSGRLKYPVIAQENGIQGRVILTFVVERDGTVSNIEVLASPDRSLSEEAIRVVSTSPKWSPGKQRGMPVRVRYNLPVDFRLN